MSVILGRVLFNKRQNVSDMYAVFLNTNVLRKSISVYIRVSVVKTKDSIHRCMTSLVGR